MASGQRMSRTVTENVAQAQCKRLLSIHTKIDHNLTDTRLIHAK